MIKATLRKGMLALPLKDRLDLIDDFDRSIVDGDSVVQIPPSHMRHLEEVIAEYEKTPAVMMSHEEMKEHLKQLKRRLSARRAGKTE